MKTNILVVGASGTVGRTVVQACRGRYGSDCFIVGTHYREHTTVSGVDALVRIDVTRPGWVDRVVLWTPLLQTEPYDYVFFCFARGAVGFPAREATPEQFADALTRSYEPLIMLEEWDVARAIVAFGSHTDLRIAQLVYGVMVHIKQYLRQWVREPSPHGVLRYLVRLGAFMSESSNSIWRFLAAELERRRGNPNDELVREFGHYSRDELRRELPRRTLQEEQATFRATRPTTTKDIMAGVEYVLARITSPPRELSIVGDITWVG